MPLVSIYKRAHEGQRDDIIVYFRRMRIALCDDKGELNPCVLMEKVPFMIIPMVDDGILLSFYLPKNFPPEDKLFIEHLIPPCHNQLRNIDTNDPLSSGFTKVEDENEMKQLYVYFKETHFQHTPMFDEGGKYHQKILCVLESIHDSILFI